jgi:hypothetical protein
MKTLNRIINQIDSSGRELPGAAVHNVALILARGSKKERNSEDDVLDEYLL